MLDPQGCLNLNPVDQVFDVGTVRYFIANMIVPCLRVDGDERDGSRCDFRGSHAVQRHFEYDDTNSVNLKWNEK